MDILFIFLMPDIFLSSSAAPLPNLDFYPPFESTEGALQSCADSVLLFDAVRGPHLINLFRNDYMQIRRKS